MTEVEYTQLQHILCGSHMEAAADGELETRLNSALLRRRAGRRRGRFAAGGQGGAAPVYPVLCPSALAADAPCLGHIDSRSCARRGAREDGSAAGTDEGTGDAPPRRARAPGPAGRRVRLEDRFNSIPAGRRPSRAARTSPPSGAPPGSGGSGPRGSSSNSCSILEAAKHQDIGLPRAFSFCYQQEIESTKQTLGSRNKVLPEQVWIKVGEAALCKQALKRNRSRMRQLDTNVERRALGEIQNVGEGATATQGAWQSSESSQANLGEQAQSGPQGGRSQRRERHNRMERDRRRRIRICCDELNLLVPFCNAETDKATTLQWTTAFLKYIQERHGDSLKKALSTNSRYIMLWTCFLKMKSAVDGKNPQHAYRTANHKWLCLHEARSFAFEVSIWAHFQLFRVRIPEGFLSI
uniref:Transcription factor like 5 n=1 Tax=Pan troglodytes TaxID=9598 RepID=H2R0Z6_PANTR